MQQEFEEEDRTARRERGESSPAAAAAAAGLHGPAPASQLLSFPQLDLPDMEGGERAGGDGKKEAAQTYVTWEGSVACCVLLQCTVAYAVFLSHHMLTCAIVRVVVVAAVPTMTHTGFRYGQWIGSGFGLFGKGSSANGS